MITALVLLSPEYLICIERLANAKSHRYASGGRRHNRAVWKCSEHRGFTPKKSRKGNVQDPSVPVIAHHKRHLKVVSRMQASGKLEVAFTERAGFAKQFGDLLGRRNQ